MIPTSIITGTPRVLSAASRLQPSATLRCSSRSMRCTRVRTAADRWSPSSMSATRTTMVNAPGSGRGSSDEHDIVIRQAKVRGRAGECVDIAIASGRIVAIEGRVSTAGKIELDARANLVTESFVDTHLHLCKVWTQELLEKPARHEYQGANMGKALSAIRLAAKVKEQYG